jgi:phosphoribosylformimino-5-aminoimidazole carboxamide ribonucleotide (ProFAR) isomerase
MAPLASGLIVTGRRYIVGAFLIGASVVWWLLYIATDGMLGGPNFEAVRQMRQAVDVPILASGGIQSAEDIERLAEIPVEGCIVGRAFYEGRLSIEEALTAAAAN